MTSQTELDLSQSLRDLVSAQPFVPDVSAIERRGHQLHRRATVGRAAAGVGVAVAVVAVAVGVNGTTGDPAPPAASMVPGSLPGSAVSGGSASGATGPAAKTVVTNLRLARLANVIKAHAARRVGNATLVLRDQRYPNSPSITGADLYTDSGEYFYAPTVSGLPAQIAANANEGDGFMKRELAAASFAASANLTVARQRMAIAALDPGAHQTIDSKRAAQQALRSQLKATTDPAVRQLLRKKLDLVEHAPRVSKQAMTDNEIWENSLDALVAGAGDAQVRAGVLRLLSTMPEVSVKDTTTAGQPSLTITASAPALPAHYQEQLTINAATGLPIRFAGGTPGQAPSVTVTYQVSRVTVADVEAGKF